MHRFTSSLVVAAASGQAVGLLGWIDPLFFPLVLLGPVITGAVAAARRLSYPWIAILWASAGVNMIWTDWVLNHEDVGFHLALTVVMPLLAGLGFGIVRLTTLVRRPAQRSAGS